MYVGPELRKLRTITITICIVTKSGFYEYSLVLIGLFFKDSYLFFLTHFVN